VKLIIILGTTRSIARTSYGNVAGWLAGWLSVTAGSNSRPVSTGLRLS